MSGGVRFRGPPPLTGPVETPGCQDSEAGHEGGLDLLFSGHGNNRFGHEEFYVGDSSVVVVVVAGTLNLLYVYRTWTAPETLVPDTPPSVGHSRSVGPVRLCSVIHH